MGGGFFIKIIGVAPSIFPKVLPGNSYYYYRSRSERGPSSQLSFSCPSPLLLPSPLSLLLRLLPQGRKLCEKLLCGGGTIELYLAEEDWGRGGYLAAPRPPPTLPPIPLRGLSSGSGHCRPSLSVIDYTGHCLSINMSPYKMSPPAYWT